MARLHPPLPCGIERWIFGEATEVASLKAFTGWSPGNLVRRGATPTRPVLGAVRKVDERRLDKAKIGEKAQFTGCK